MTGDEIAKHDLQMMRMRHAEGDVSQADTMQALQRTVGRLQRGVAHSLCQFTKTLFGYGGQYALFVRKVAIGRGVAHASRARHFT